MVKNLSSELKKQLPQRIVTLLRGTGTKASKMGQNVFLVGGVVRDLFLGRANLDLDVVVEGDAIELAKRLSQENGVKALLHHRFGTAKLNFGDFSLDIATARRESYRCPGALPDVQPGTIADDLFRRDFSINAMALYLTPARFGELIDVYHGRNDIREHHIRVLHPNSFVDDATRIFRAIRYEQRLGFAIEPHTAELLHRDLPMVDTVSGDRLRHELMLMLMEEYPERSLRRAGELGVLGKLSPSLKGDSWLSEKFEQARQLGKRSSLAPLYLCLLVYRLSERELGQLVTRLNFPKTLAQAMHQTLQLKAQFDQLARPALKSSDIYRLLCSYVPSVIEAAMLASPSELVKHHLHLYLTRLRYMKPRLNGDDLREFGVPAGPSLGKLLVALHEARLNGEVATRHDEERLVRRWLGSL